MPRGGRRPGAGRKPALHQALQLTAARGISPQQVAKLHMAMLVALYRAAMRGSAAAARKYLAGRPEPSLMEESANGS